MCFPPGLDYAPQLGERPLTLQFILDNAHDVEVEMAAERRNLARSSAREESAEDEDMREVDEEMVIADDALAAPGSSAASKAAQPFAKVNGHPTSTPRKRPNGSQKSNLQVSPKGPKPLQKARDEAGKLPTSKISPSRQAAIDNEDYNPSSRESESATRSTTNDDIIADDDEDESLQGPSRKSTGKPASHHKSPSRKGTAQQKSSRLRRDASEDEDEDEDDVRESPSKNTRSKARDQPAAEGDEDEDDNVEAPRGRLRQKSSASKAKPKSSENGLRRSRRVSRHKSTDTAAQTRSRQGSRRRGTEQGDEGTATDLTESGDDSPAKAVINRRRDSVISVSPTKPKSSDKRASSKLTPRRTLSILLPPEGTGPSLSQERIRRVETPKGKGRARPVTPEDEDDSDEEDVFTRKKKKAASPLRRSQGSSVVVEIITPSTVGRARRRAANKATQRLHDEIMPDVNKFQKEVRRGSVRALAEKELEAEARALKSKGKAKTAAQPASKRRKSAAANTDDEDEDAPEPELKKRRLSGKGKAKAVETDEEEEPELEIPKKSNVKAKVKNKGKARAVSEKRGETSEPG